jgi:hypothetical protein
MGTNISEEHGFFFFVEVMIHISIFIEECLFVGKFRATVIPPDIMF